MRKLISIVAHCLIGATLVAVFVIPLLRNAKFAVPAITVAVGTGACAGFVSSLVLRFFKIDSRILVIVTSVFIWICVGALIPQVIDHFQPISGDGGAGLVSIVYATFGAPFGVMFGLIVSILGSAQVRHNNSEYLSQPIERHER